MFAKSSSQRIPLCSVPFKFRSAHVCDVLLFPPARAVIAIAFLVRICTFLRVLVPCFFRARSPYAYSLASSGLRIGRRCSSTLCGLLFICQVALLRYCFFNLHCCSRVCHLPSCVAVVVSRPPRSRTCRGSKSLTINTPETLLSRATSPSPTSTARRVLFP